MDNFKFANEIMELLEEIYNDESQVRVDRAAYNTGKYETLTLVAKKINQLMEKSN